MDSKYELIKFEDGEFSLDVSVDPSEDTVWSTKEQIAALFNCDRTVILKHINKIYKEKELEMNSTCAKLAQVQTEGNRKVTRNTEYYNKVNV